MDIQRLANDTDLRHHEFPITRSKVFLAHAAASPLPRRVSKAMAAYVSDASALGQWEYLWGGIEKQARQRAAALIGAGEDEIAFVSSTSMGLSLVACGLDWREGDNVVIADGDFPSNIYPWLNLERRGVTIKMIPRRADGAITEQDIDRIVDGRTRLVSLSSVSFVTGFKIDIASLGKRMHERGTLFCIDGVQSLGMAPMDTSYVDFMTASAHKWLLGPLGIGILFVKRKSLGLMRPVLAGWKCVHENKHYLNYNLCFSETADRYEPGGLNAVGLVGLNAALGLLLDVGVARICERVDAFRREMVPSLAGKGYMVLGPPCGDHSSAITSFVAPGQDIASLRQALDAQGYIVSLRDCLDGGKCIRVAPHFYNTEEEIGRFLDILPNCPH